MQPLLPLVLAASLATSPPPGPTVAVEDTLSTSVPEVLVRAPRVTLEEILDRVARGEARRDSQMTDQVYLSTVRLVRHTAEPGKTPELVRETVTRVYKKKPGRVRTQVLRNFDATRKEKGARAEVRVRTAPGMDEGIVNFAFQPEARREYRYRIEGRDFRGGHLIYRIRFEPRSLLDRSKPKGLVWVDTNEFVIVRQEVGFDRSPAPPFVKAIDRMVVERQRVDGHWVLKRVLARVEMNLPLPKIGRSFDLAIRHDEYAINAGLADAIFTRGASE